MHERNDLAELCTIHAFLVSFVDTAGNGPFKVAQERRALKLLKPASDFEIPFAHMLSKIQCIESAVHASVSIIQAVRYVNQIKRSLFLCFRVPTEKESTRGNVRFLSLQHFGKWRRDSAFSRTS